MVDALERSQKRYTILVKTGIYDEIVRIKRSTWNLTLAGYGARMTVTAGNRSADDGFTTCRVHNEGSNSPEHNMCLQASSGGTLIVIR
uniref:Pectinesterase catalytic domain-containing protein n=1 Tax=Leersia perrieri TaxID=77586 RepID=A0A0D9VWK6_9ORYZ